MSFILRFLAFSATFSGHLVVVHYWYAENAIVQRQSPSGYLLTTVASIDTRQYEHYTRKANVHQLELKEKEAEFKLGQLNM